MIQPQTLNVSHSVLKEVKSSSSQENPKLRMSNLNNNFKSRMKSHSGWKRMKRKSLLIMTNISTEESMKIKLVMTLNSKGSKTKSLVSSITTWRSSNIKGKFLNNFRALLECIQKKNMTIFLSLIDELVQRGSLIRTIKSLSADEVSRVVDFLRPLVHNEKYSKITNFVLLKVLCNSFH